MQRDEVCGGEEDKSQAATTCWLRVEPLGVVMNARPRESVLEAAARAGWQLPSSCRNGTCRACLCRLVTGAIRYRVDWPGLSDAEKRTGWMLACVAVPVSDVVIEQADAVAAVAPRLPARGF
ncbi:MAG: 2Fe-2S iron-sulfur cluster-binding protein [Janthinobacterium lividum]